jgi:PAS domain S-box-containing protein
MAVAATPETTRAGSAATPADATPDGVSSQPPAVAGVSSQPPAVAGVSSQPPAVAGDATSDPDSPPQAQGRLDDARFWLAAIAGSSDDAIVGKDLKGNVTSWNKAAETMFGHTRDEIIGQKITRIIPKDRLDEETLILDRIRRSERIDHFETKRQCKDGRIIPVSLTVSPIRDDRGEIIGVSKIARDLSETQRIHARLERREALLRSILDTVPDAMIVIDKQGDVHSFSVAAVRLFGYTSAEMVGRNISVLLPSTDWQPADPERTGPHGASPNGRLPTGQLPTGQLPTGQLPAGQLPAGQLPAGRFANGPTGGPIRDIDYGATGEHPITGIGQRRDRSTFPMKLVIGEVNLPRAQLFTAFVQDQSEPVERERELRAANTELERLARNLATARDVADRANWAKSRFLAGMSHELRTPLNGILGYAELLRMEGGLNPTQSERVAAMLGAGKYLLQMITRVLDLSEIEAEHIELQAVEVDVLTVAMACLDVVRPQADAKRLALSIAVARDTRHTVVTDPTRLRQVLLNLLGNAVKFTAKGSIELRLRHVTDAFVLRIEVADTGPGIAAGERRRLFRDFERLGDAVTRSVEGAGLGLGLSARLAALLGGCLGHHDNPGGGSVFWLELPLDTVATSPAAVPCIGESETLADIQPLPSVVLKVLVVDDVAMNRDIAGSFLRAAGHQVSCVEGGKEAVAAVNAAAFDVVLMDVRMPEMDGLEATRRIRSLDGEHGRVPIVALTAQAFTEQVEECRKAGMNGHVSKPFDPETLLSAVLRAHEAGTMGIDDLRPAVLPSAAAPVLGSDIVVFNAAAFERTANYLAPEVVASYLEDITARGETLLSGLRRPDALIRQADELADAAHAIAGSAGLLGFERLTAMGRRFSRAAHAGAAEAPSLADGLGVALEVTLQTLHDRTLIAADA